MIDLHIHSIYSDGTLFPKQIINLANKKKLNAISITDHNTIAPKVCSNKLKIISGVELKVIHNGRKLEILGYGFEKDEVKRKIEDQRRKSIEIAKQILKRFNKKASKIESNFFTLKLNNPKVSLKDFLKFKLGNKFSESFCKYYLKHANISKLELAEFFYKTCFKSNKQLSLAYGEAPVLLKRELSEIFNLKQRYMSLERAIKIIKNSNGFVIMPHPYIFFNKVKNWDQFLKELIKIGIDGLELYNYSGILKFTKQAESRINFRFRKLARRHNLLITYGSDCHGDKWWGRQIGKFYGPNNLKILQFL